MLALFINWIKNDKNKVAKDILLKEYLNPKNQKKAIKEAAVGAVIEATATDPGVLIDIPAWARTTGNEVIKIEREGKIVHFFVRRLK